MRRAIRWAWNGLAAVSLLLCVAALAAWPASFQRSSYLNLYWTRPASVGQPAVRGAVGAATGGGLVALTCGRTLFVGPAFPAPSAGPDEEHGVDLPVRYPGPSSAKLAKFATGTEGFVVLGMDTSYGWLVAPLWAWALAFALLPGCRALGWYRRRRRVSGPAFEVVRMGEDGRGA